VPDLGALNALRHPLGSTRCGCHHEKLRNATIKDGTNIQGLEREEQKTEQKRDSPFFDPLAIATMGIKEMESRKQKHQQARGSIHTLLDQWGSRTKEERKEKWNLHPFIQIIMKRAKVGSKEARSPKPNPLVGCHDRESKWHKAISTAHSDAVVSARSGEMPW
jgi:hypothetical protein